jgi:cell division protease FtsH
VDRKKLTAYEEQVIAAHEAGHAVCALLCPHAEPIKRVALADDVMGGASYVRHQDPANGEVWTRNQMLARICVAFGGREAEQLIYDDVSWGCAQDLQQATQIARHMVELYGMGGPEVGSASVPATDPEGRWKRDGLSAGQLEAVDRRIRDILEEQRLRAAAILRDNRVLVETLRDLLIEKRVIEAKTLKSVVGDSTKEKATLDDQPAAPARA